MDEELENAAIGNTKSSALSRFIYDAVESKPIQYFQSVHRARHSQEIGGNIFHLAAYHNNVDFFEATLGALPEKVVHSLLCQQEATRVRRKKSWPWKPRNPIHTAAQRGNYLVVRILIEFYRRDDRTDSWPPFLRHKPWRRRMPEHLDLEPWLAQDRWTGRTPLHHALKGGHESLSLEILSLIGVESVSGLEDENGQSPLFLAVKRGLNRVVDVILCSNAPCSLRGHHDCTALFFAPNCSDDVCGQLLRRYPELIVGTDETNNTVLHRWVEIGKLYPFKQVLKSDFILPDLRKEFIDQLCTRNDQGKNPLHIVAESKYDEGRRVEVARFLVESYKRERPEALSMQQKAKLPWFKRVHYSPLALAIQNKSEQLALFFLSLDSVYFVVENDENYLLYLAIEYGCPKLANEILDIVDERNMTHLLTLRGGITVLHVAPKCSEGILKRLLENYPELVNGCDQEGKTVLHSWMNLCKLWPFEHVLKRDYMSAEWKSSFIRLLGKHDKEKRKPLHLAAELQGYDDKGGDIEVVVEQIVELLLTSWKSEKFRHPKQYQCFDMDKNGHTPLTRAVFLRRQKLTLCFLVRHHLSQRMENGEVADILFKAIEYEWHEVVKFIILYEGPRRESMDVLRSGRENALHVGWKSTEEICKLLMTETWPARILIHERDDNGKTPLERASEVGATWLVELILQVDRSAIINIPLAWIEACKNRHLSTVLAFAEKSLYFGKLCREYRDTPLHHLQDLTYKEYQELLESASINELKNIQNSQGETPLHTAIKSKNKNLTEILLTMGDVDRTIKDNDSKTAMDLLKEMCDQDPDWGRMCDVIGVDPKLKTAYIQLKTNLAEMRSIISLVAALLATITFQAAFTIPGGFNNNSGEPILVTKAAFLVFVISDTYAMCCSMLILFCIIWSMVCDHSKSSLLIDRSLVLLKQSLYGTLLAFMTGVYTAIHHKSLWAAIVVIIMCSVVVISANRSILYKVLPKLIPASKDDYRFLQFLHCWNRKNQQEQIQEATPLNNQIAIQAATPVYNQGEPEPIDSTV